MLAGSAFPREATARARKEHALMSESPGGTPTEASTAPAAPEPPPPFLDRLSDGLQNAIKVLIGTNRKPPRRFKSLLHGTWLRHPLHPAITDVPLAAWLITALFDVIWLVAPAANSWAAQAALVTAAVGVLAGLGAFVTGSADWSDTYGAERRVGLYHGLLNTLAIALFAVSVLLRLGAPAHETVLAAVLGFAGVVSVSVAAYLGGDMVFHKGTQVNHTAWEAGGEEYEPVLALADVSDRRLYRVTAAGVPVVLLRMGDQFFAISATCSHAGGPLDEGELQGDVVQCPWHGSRFSLRTGHVRTGPATMAQPRYAVRIQNGQIEVKRISGH
jgi:nitrite reductase/ring-hydroxylating ferredoxin subunit/uncharacterized membrane protein